MLICFLVWLPIGFWSRDSTTTSTQRAPWLSHSVPALDNNSRHLHRPSQIQPSHLLHAVADQLCRKEEQAKHCLFRSSRAEREAQTDSFHCFLSSGYKEALCAFNLSSLQPWPSWRINNSTNTNINIPLCSFYTGPWWQWTAKTRRQRCKHDCFSWFRIYGRLSDFSSPHVK